MSATSDSASGLPAAGVAASARERRFLLFTLGDASFAIDSAPVQEVLPVPPLTRVPRGQSWLVGLMNLRGEVVPVVNPRPALHCRVESGGTQSRVIVLRCSRGRVGFVADSTEDIALVVDADILPADHGGKSLGPSIVGALLRGDRLVSLIDSESFFAGPAFQTS